MNAIQYADRNPELTIAVNVAERTAMISLPGQAEPAKVDLALKKNDLTGDTLVLACYGSALRMAHERLEDTKAMKVRFFIGNEQHRKLLASCRPGPQTSTIQLAIFKLLTQFRAFRVTRPE